MGAPSRRPRQSSHVAARHRFAQASPKPIGDGCGSLCGLGHPRLCSRALSWVRFLGRHSPQVNQGVAFARDVAQVDGYLTVVDFPQRPHHCRATPTDSRPDFGNAEGSNTNTPSPCPELRANLVKQRLSQGGIVPVGPADEALQPQAVSPNIQAIDSTFSACHVRQQAADIRFLA